MTTLTTGRMAVPWWRRQSCCHVRFGVKFISRFNFCALVWLSLYQVEWFATLGDIIQICGHMMDDGIPLWWSRESWYDFSPPWLKFSSWCDFQDVDVSCVVEMLLAIAIYVSSTSVDHPGWPAAVSPWMFVQWLILSCLLTSKGSVFIFGIAQSVATSCYKMRDLVPSAKPRNLLVKAMESEQQFSEENVIGIWTFNGTNRSIINKIRTFMLVASFILCQRSYSLGSPVHPSQTNDHHHWSLHHGYLWRSPQHTEQIDLMCLSWSTESWYNFSLS